MQPRHRTNDQRRPRGATDDEKRTIKKCHYGHATTDGCQQAKFKYLSLHTGWCLCTLWAFHLLIDERVCAVPLVSFEDEAAIEVHSCHHCIWPFWEHLILLFLPLLLLPCFWGRCHLQIHRTCILTHYLNLCQISLINCGEKYAAFCLPSNTEIHHTLATNIIMVLIPSSLLSVCLVNGPENWWTFVLIFEWDVCKVSLLKNAKKTVITV